MDTPCIKGRRIVPFSVYRPLIIVSPCSSRVFFYIHLRRYSGSQCRFHLQPDGVSLLKGLLVRIQ